MLIVIVVSYVQCVYLFSLVACCLLLVALTFHFTYVLICELVIKFRNCSRHQYLNMWPRSQHLVPSDAFMALALERATALLSDDARQAEENKAWLGNEEGA